MGRIHSDPSLVSLGHSHQAQSKQAKPQGITPFTFMLKNVPTWPSDLGLRSLTQVVLPSGAAPGCPFIHILPKARVRTLEPISFIKVLQDPRGKGAETIKVQ